MGTPWTMRWMMTSTNGTKIHLHPTRASSPALSSFLARGSPRSLISFLQHPQRPGVRSPLPSHQVLEIIRDARATSQTMERQVTPGRPRSTVKNPSTTRPTHLPHRFPRAPLCCLSLPNRQSLGQSPPPFRRYQKTWCQSHACSPNLCWNQRRLYVTPRRCGTTRESCRQAVEFEAE